jgi:hypothetical protein
VRPMLESAREFANAPEPFDYRTMIDHAPFVRVGGTMSRVEPVRPNVRYVAIMSAVADDTLGMKMRALRARSGMSLGNIAKALNRPRSSIQKFFEEAYRPGGRLDIEDAIAFAGVLVGKGEPPISYDDLMSLTALPLLPAVPAEVQEALSPNVADTVARALAMVALGGQEPPEETTAALARMLQELSALYQRDPAMRVDARRTQGVLDLLTLRLSQPGRALQ